MTTIKEILRNTYQLTFDVERDYDWISISETMVDSENVVEELQAMQLLKSNESNEKILYWQDVFFMEIAELGGDFTGDDSFLYEKIKKNPLYKDNERFIGQLPKVTTDLGRELLIEAMIENKHADQLIPNHIIESSLKKKSREDLRKEFENWNEETTQGTRTETNVKNSSKVNDAQLRVNKSKSFKLLNLLIAACIVGVIVTVGINILKQDKHSFEGNSYVITTEKSIIKNNGLGYVENENTPTIVLQILNYDDAIASDPVANDKLILNSYSFTDKTLKLILSNNNVDAQIIELDHNKLYLSLDNEFYKIDSSKSYKNLEIVDNKGIVEELERIIFENE